MNIIMCFAAVFLAACVVSIVSVNKKYSEIIERYSNIIHIVKALEKEIYAIKAEDEESRKALEDKISENIEKKWDAGLQNIMNFNPFSVRSKE